MNDLVFAERRSDAYPHGSWKVLIVDDDPGIHAITKTVLRDLVYDNRTLEFLSAGTRAEAEELLRRNEDIAIVLLDVVMEEDDSGLRLVHFIREDLNDHLPRIILRTGQPGKAPSHEVIVNYDINDYEEKTDLTAQRLYTTIVTSLRNYNDLRGLDANLRRLSRHRSGLSRTIDASAQLFSAKDVGQFCLVTHDLLVNLFDEGSCASSFAALQDRSDFHLAAATGQYKKKLGDDPRSILGEESFAGFRALRRENRSLIIQDKIIQIYQDARKFRMLFHVELQDRLSVHDRRLLDMFASNLSLAFENLRLGREITGTREDLIVRLSEVVETRSHETAQHVRRVGELCEFLGLQAGMDRESAHELRLASALHDIGKIGISDEILLKPDALTDEEFTTMKKHTVIGHQMLENSPRPLLKKASLICLQHHEHFDGQGYPAGITGDSIHINARIVSICDVFDSLSHGRIHRKSWNIDDVAAYMADQKAKAFDPVLIDQFLDNIETALKINDDFPD